MNTNTTTNAITPKYYVVFASYTPHATKNPDQMYPVTTMYIQASDAAAAKSDGTSELNFLRANQKLEYRIQDLRLDVFDYGFNSPEAAKAGEKEITDIMNKLPVYAKPNDYNRRLLSAFYIYKSKLTAEANPEAEYDTNLLNLNLDPETLRGIAEVLFDPKFWPEDKTCWFEDPYLDDKIRALAAEYEAKCLINNGTGMQVTDNDYYNFLIALYAVQILEGKDGKDAIKPYLKETPIRENLFNLAQERGIAHNLVLSLEKLRIDIEYGI